MPQYVFKMKKGDLEIEFSSEEEAKNFQKPDFFGKEVTVGIILKQLEKINEILSINLVEIFDEDANVVVEKILLRDEELPFLNNIIIEKR